MNPQQGICAPARAASTRVSGSQNGSRGDAKGGREFAGGYLLAVLVLRFEHLDPATLRGDEKAAGADLGYFANLAFDVTERAEQVLAAIENLQFLAPQGGPCARRGIAAADQIVDEFDVVRPVDSGLGGPT